MGSRITTESESIKEIKEENVVQRKGVECFESHSFKDHNSSVFSSLYFPINQRAVTCSSDNTVNVWDINSQQCIKSLKHHMDDVYHLIKWDEEKGIFLSCSKDSFIFSVSVITLKVIKKSPMLESTIIFMQKLSPDKLLCIQHQKAMVIRYSDMTVLRSLDNNIINGHDWSKISLSNSKKYPNCFYMNGDRCGEDIYMRLIDYENSNVVREYKRLDYAANSLSVLSKEKEELIFVGTRKLLVYNSEITSAPIRVIKMKDEIYSSSIFKDRFLILGLSRNLRLCDIKDECVFSFPINIHKSPIVEVRSIKLGAVKPGEFNIMTSSEDNSCKIINFKNVPNLNLGEDFSLKDLKERIEYLIYLSEEPDLSNDIESFKIVLNGQSWKYFKSFLY